jgi:hypothetical protein
MDVAFRPKDFRRDDKKVLQTGKKLFSTYKILTSGKLLPIIVLVVIPMMTVLAYIFFNLFTSVYFGFLFIVTIVLYAPYRAAYSTEEYFKRRGYENVINEYRIIKYILSGVIPLYAFLTFVSLRPEFERNFAAVLGQGVLASITIVLLYIIIAGLIKIILQVIRKDFRLYFSMGCFRVYATKEDEIEKMRYLVWGINAYNLYIRRYLKLEINNIKKIYSKISSASSTERNKLRDSLDAAFKTGKLEPLQCLSKYLQIKENEELLVKESILRRIKEAAAFLAIVIPILISLFELMKLLPQNVATPGG